MLCFSRRGNVRSADLVLDVIVRNTGTIGVALTGIQAEVFDWRLKMHGLPGDGLLFPQITYAVSIRGGKSGVYFAECEPPLLVEAGDLERFKIRITDTGYAWNGGLRVSLQTGPLEKLTLPALRVLLDGNSTWRGSCRARVLWSLTFSLCSRGLAQRERRIFALM